MHPSEKDITLSKPASLVEDLAYALDGKETQYYRWHMRSSFCVEMLSACMLHPNEPPQLAFESDLPA